MNLIPQKAFLFKGTIAENVSYGRKVFTEAEYATVILVAQRISTIKHADRILVLEDGDIKETGNHKSLMEKNGLYTKLYNSQFANDNEG